MTFTCEILIEAQGESPEQAAAAFLLDLRATPSPIRFTVYDEDGHHRVTVDPRALDSVQA
jgi:hypothetical protein